MTTKEMEELVIEEATNLREKATQGEKNLLNIESLNADSIGSCIYGQMTGDCYSERAKQLIESCCSKVYNADRGNLSKTLTLNGSPLGKKRNKDGMTWLVKPNIEYYSPIEVMLSNEASVSFLGTNLKIISLVKYIKGEIDSLTF